MAITESRFYEQPVHEEAAGPANLLRLAQLLWNNILIIAAVGALCAALAFGASMLLPNLYVATAQILLDPEGSRVLESDLASQPRAVDSHVLNQQYIITSAQVLSRIVDSEKLYDDPAFGAADASITDLKGRSNLALEALRKATSVAVAGKSFVVNVSVRSESPERAAHLANLIAQTYTQVRADMNSDVLRRTGGGLAAQLDQLRAAVEEGDRAVQAYRAEHNLADVQGRPDVELRIANINTEISRLAATVAENEALVGELGRVQADRQYLRSIPDTSLTPAIISVRARYQASQEEEAVLATSLGGQHPSLQAARARTQALSQTLNEQLRNFSTTTSRNLERLKNQLGLLRSDADRLKSSLNSEEQTMVRLRELQRKLESDRAVYESFLLRTKQLSEQEGTSSENPQIISEAEPPLRKAGPPRSLILAGGGIFGLILASGLIILRDQFAGARGEARSQQRYFALEERRSAGMNALPQEQAEVVPGQAASGAVSRFDVPAGNVAPLIAPSRDGYNELARFVSAAIRPAANHSIMVVATGPKDCASYAAFNLAAAVSRLDRRVLLVDANTSDQSLTGQLLPSFTSGASGRETARHPLCTVENMPFLQFAPAADRGGSGGDAGVGSWLHSSKSSQPFDLIVVDGGVAGRHGVSGDVAQSLNEVFLMQPEDDAGSVLIALFALEGSGFNQVKVVRMTRHGLQY